MEKTSARCHSTMATMSSFPQCNGITGPKYRDWVSNTICNKRNKTFQLNSPDGATLTVGVLDDTKCNAADLNAWGKFFLPTTVQMQVVGYVEGSPYPCDQLVLMTCEDKKFYGYDGDELHLVAPSLEHLCQVGVDYPASRSFYRGEAFKHTTSEEWDELRKGPVGKRLDKEHHQLVSKHKDSFLKNLRLGAEKRRCHQQHGPILSDAVLRQLQNGGA
ncbi:uncharacterized protein LOC101164904 isoform X2 [Oryzias latipes]|uniref:uncharacterized protein LOC101164904 isoform X2 n=1 Tax=Oryzias latipes TaxID=8090 RepID=UPI000CE240C2|nr:uncharacterized protein LOC101164904 isoform X2 [Oryzias latipes]